MSSTQGRLVRIGAVYGVALVCVLGYLLFVMTARHDEWLVRSYQNRWSFRDVPSVRGALLDRFDRPLAQDEPVFELSCVYERFRLFHPVGAAIHGASLWEQLRGGVPSYTYAAGERGPDVAAHDLLSLPVTALSEGVLPKETRRALLQSVLTVLSACSERSLARIRTDLRAALRNPGMLQIGDVVRGCAVEDMEEQFAALLARFRALDASLAQLLPTDALSAPLAEGTAPSRGLVAQLDRLREDSLAQRRTRHSVDGVEHEGELLERIGKPLFANVPFALAAALRVAAADQPGLILEPSLRRQDRAGLPNTLAQLLGGVADLDRMPPRDDKSWQRWQDYVEARVETAMADDLDDLVPDAAVPSQEQAEALRAEAQRSYEHLLRTRERRGSSGIEAMLDSELAGTPGMRLVEQNARSREQLLWGSLRVQPGNDVALTLDLDLQTLLEAHVQSAARHWQGVARERGRDEQRIDVACALIDARSGDVLALASAPSELAGKPRIPAVLSWRGNGAIGSLAKPLFLAEQLAAASQGFPHKDLATFEGCNRHWHKVGGQKLECDGVHGAAGARPETALAKSCNIFFFQAAEGLGEEGLRRALWRFGLLAPDTGSDTDRFQPRPPELPAALAAAPRWIGRQLVPLRGIGYGIESNPLMVARAYAALATGQLPTLGLRRGEGRLAWPLGIDESDLSVVREGLRECVASGTASDLMQLQAFSVHGKTGTAEVGSHDDNNAWFAGYLPGISAQGVQLCFCAVVYAVPDKTHGADAGGLLVAEVLGAMAADAQLHHRYLGSGGGR